MLALSIGSLAFLGCGGADVVADTAGAVDSPDDDATILGLTTLLTWSGGDDPDGDPVSYLVRFGTTNPPPNLRTVFTRSTLTPGVLEFSRTYYWQIVARDDHSHETPGPVWSFHTLGPPNEAPSPPCWLA